MTRLFSCLLWTVVFLLIVLAVDQALLRLSPHQPTTRAVTSFYRDLRSRLLDLASKKPGETARIPAPPAKPKPPAAGKEVPTPPVSIESVIEKRQSPQPAAPAKAQRPAPAAETRYIYADDQGALHFAATLAESPEQYRGTAKLMGE